MDGYKAYRYYIALKLHFTTTKYNVFETRGNIRSKYESFLKRPDKKIFESLARNYDDKTYIQYIASNMIYNNFNVLYDKEIGEKFYITYLKRKQSITKIFNDDLDYISFTKDYSLFDLFLQNKITIETVSIINDLDGITNQLRSKESMKILFNDDLLRIEKSKGFIKYDHQKTHKIYLDFKANNSYNIISNNLI